MSVSALPSAPMSEKFILSLMFDDPSRNIPRASGEGLTSQMFHHHSILFERLVAHFREHDSFELTHFIQSLNLAGDLARCGGASEISGIYTYAIGNAGAWSHHVKLIREAYARRIALIESSRMPEAEDSDQAIAKAQKMLEDMKEAVSGPRKAVTAFDAVEDFCIQQQKDYEIGEIPGKPTGITEIDDVSGGMRPGEFWVIGGKPSRGKTALMIQIAGETILRDEFVIGFSLEMKARVMIGRMVSCIGSIPYGLINQPRKIEQKITLQRIKETAQRISRSNLWIDDQANQTADSIHAEATRVKESTGSLDLIFVDYIQLISGIKGMKETREQEVARVSRSLKQIAMELDCPVIAATQLNEEGRARESKAIEQDADAFIGICDEGLTAIKMRNAPRNEVFPLFLNGNLQRFKRQ